MLKYRDEMKMQVAEMKFQMRVVGVTRLDCMRNEVIREKLNLEAVVAQVKRRREAWREKVIENEGSLVNRMDKLQAGDPGEA